MNTTKSQDGTSIAFERVGKGPPVILVGGAFGYRAFPKLRQLAKLLAAEGFTAINYDRRGRGDSGDTAPYAVEREIEDLEAIMGTVGGSASVFGWSSGGALALRTAAGGLSIDKLAVYEPPFLVDDSGPLPPADFASTLHQLTASERRAEAVKHYMTKGMGVPPIVVTMMRVTPFWPKLKAVAHTLPYDWAVMGDTMAGKPLSTDPWSSVTAPTLAIAGEKSEARLRHAAQAIVEVLPNAEYRTLGRQSHNVSMKALAPVLAEFFAAKGS